MLTILKAKSIKRDELKNALANLLNDLREQSEKSKLALCSVGYSFKRFEFYILKKKLSFKTKI